MQNSVTLPQWLDNLIFEKLGAKYCRSNSDMTVIDWDKNDVLNYLGTYFPRSYAESYCIFREFFHNYPNQFEKKEEISVFDFGCGTGGEIIGFLTALSEFNQKIKKIRIVALDGNPHALKLYDKVLESFKTQTMLCVESLSAQVCIDDFYDMNILNSVIKKKFDAIITFKAICEFVTKQQFENKNAYEYIANVLLPKLTACGLLLFVDVTTYNNISSEWLPKMMDKGLFAANCNVIARNDGYNQSFVIRHSRNNNDVSKVAWRMIRNNI